MRKTAPVDIKPILRAMDLIDDCKMRLETVAEEYYGRGNKFAADELFKSMELIDLALMEVEFLYDEVKAHYDEEFEPPIG